MSLILSPPAPEPAEPLLGDDPATVASSGAPMIDLPRRRVWTPARRRTPQRVPIRRLGDDRGSASAIESLFAGLFLVLLFLFFAQVVVWWHARNILEQAAAEGARVAAAADGSCADAPAAASAIAARIGGGWARSATTACRSGAGEGAIVVVTVHATTPAFFLPGSLGVTATATAPREAP